jgi:hypothetical protein
MTSASVSCRLVGALPLLALAHGVAHGQGRARAAARCDGRVIHEIRVSALRPPFKGEAAYWRRVARSIGLHHATTDTAVVRRFLALETGGICTDFRLRESARLLREEPFLADARIRSVPDDSGGVRVEVETIDEIPALASVSIGSGRLSYLEIGNENMFGDAWLLAIHGSDRPLEGRSAGFRMTDFQFLGRPYQFDAQADRGQRTSAWLLDASHAYRSDLQRIAWEAGLARAGQEFAVVHRGEGIDDLALEYRRFAADVGGVVKLGNLRTPILLGALASLTRLQPMGSVAVGKRDIRPDTALVGRYPKVSRARLTGVAAWRNLNYVTAHGFDALTATQDVPTGFQLFGQLGRGTHSLSGASDVYMLADMLAGAGSAKTYSELHLITEGRREIGQHVWDGVVSSGRLALFWKPNEPHVVRAWTEYAGGWRVQAPFQLALATENQRLIGYRGSLFGARRVAGGLEMRRVLSHITSRADVGVGAFVNAARLWAGDAPYGVDTPLLPSAGISLFGALPRGSQRLLRIDLGAPLRTGIVRSGWEARLSYSDFTRTLRLEPRDIANAREQLVGPDIFRP